MKYSNFSIEQLITRLAELFNKKSTPKRTAVLALEAIEVIKQLQKAAALPPNPPLTLDELRQMDGEPVWIDISSSRSCWAIVKNYDEQHNMIKFSGFGGLSCDIYGKYWLAWRRRPEECGDIDNCLDMLEDVELALRRTEKIIAKEEEP